MAKTKDKGAKTGGKDKKTGDAKPPKKAAKKRPATSVEDAVSTLLMFQSDATTNVV